jgi:hypothetical protein
VEHNVHVSGQLIVNDRLLDELNVVVEILGCAEIAVVDTSLRSARWFARFEPMKPAPPVTRTR